MILLNSKSIRECKTDQEIDSHNKEIIDIINKLNDLDDFDCAVLCKYQDKGHKELPMKIEATTLHSLSDIFEWGDCKNGCDIMVDDGGEYLVIVTLGQSYQMKGEEHWYTVVEAFKVLPYDQNKNFLNIINYVMFSGKLEYARNQFEEKYYN